MSQPNPSESTRKNGEGLVVVDKGVRVSGEVHTTDESANREAEAVRKHRLDEKGGSPAPQVKQQLFG